MVYDMVNDDEKLSAEVNNIIRELIELERNYFFERRNVKTERRRKLRDLIERHTKPGDQGNDS